MSEPINLSYELNHNLGYLNLPNLNGDYIDMDAIGFRSSMHNPLYYNIYLKVVSDIIYRFKNE
jgi:hypothetical protein